MRARWLHLRGEWAGKRREGDALDERAPVDHGIAFPQLQPRLEAGLRLRRLDERGLEAAARLTRLFFHEGRAPATIAEAAEVPCIMYGAWSRESAGSGTMSAVSTSRPGAQIVARPVAELHLVAFIVERHRGDDEGTLASTRPFRERVDGAVPDGCHHEEDVGILADAVA